MIYEPLFNNFKRFISLSEEDEQVVVSLLMARSFKRGQFITSEGEINRFTNFITQGSVRVYYIDLSGQEHVIQLGIENWWVGDYPSFIGQQPGLLYTEALQATETLSFSYENMQILYEKMPQMERFFRLLTQRAYIAFQHRMLHNLSMDAESRYVVFRNTYPALEEKIAQKHVASYLGMSPEFLSKVKKRVMMKMRLRRSA
jgi:CRP-like cAMP-binding protein